jgi:hypothetical protein
MSAEKSGNPGPQVCKALTSPLTSRKKADESDKNVELL